jgi:hypothetical protein
MAKPNRNTQPSQPSQPPVETPQPDPPVAPPVSGAETPPDAGTPPPPADGTSVPPVESAEEEEASTRIKTSWFGDVCTWNVPGYTGEAPTLDTSKLTPNVRNLAFRAGIQAKGVDGAAKKKGTPPADKAAFIKRVCANLIAGKWKADRGESMGDGILMVAVNQLYQAAKGAPKFADVAEYHKWLTDGAAANECTVEQFITQQEARSAVRPVVDKLRLAALADVKFDADDVLDA